MRSYHAALMSGRLPAQIDPIRLAEEGTRLAGELPIRDFARLREACGAESWPDPVMIELTFERTIQGMRVMRGRLQARITMTCQRCLEPVAVKLEANPFCELLLPGEASSGMPGDADTLVVDGPQRLSEIVEEELLLVMPMVPMHDAGECTAPGVADNAGPAPERRSGPFSVLRENGPKD